MARSNHKKSRHTRTWIVVLIICLVELLAFTWFRVQHVRTGYEISQLTQQNRRLKEQQNLLKAELASTTAKIKVNPYPTTSIRRRISLG